MIRQDRENQRRETNRAKRLEAIRRLEQALEFACKPGFSGKVGVEVTGHEEQLGRVTVTVVDSGSSQYN